MEVQVVEATLHSIQVWQVIVDGKIKNQFMSQEYAERRAAQLKGNQNG